MRVTDLALLIKAHEFRNTDFESAVYDVIDKTTDMTEEQKAHVYAVVVENCQPHSPVEDIEEYLRKGYNGRPR